MPVQLVNQPRCGVCGRIKGETNRWFLIRILGPELSYRDYNPEFLAEYDEAICGMACLDERHHAHAQKLIGMRSANAQQTSSISEGATLSDATGDMPVSK